MKKLVVSLVFFLAMILQIYAQDIPITHSIDKCLSLLGKNVPEGFQRMSRSIYTNDEGLILRVENGIVVLSIAGSIFNRFDAATKFNTSFYDYFENNNWNFYNSPNAGTDIYVKNGIYACISIPSKHDNGLIISQILFSRNINYF
jgi:hypothetical protein